MRTLGDMLKIRSVKRDLNKLRRQNIITADEYFDILDILYRS